jgi:predicted permease
VFRIEPLTDAFVVQKERTRLLVLWAAVGCVLLIACANAANLLMARAAVRRRELAVRSALGAGRGTLMRQLLAESVLLAFGGGALGATFAWWGVRALPALISPVLLAGRPPIAVDARVLLFTLALSVATGFFFGMFPAWRASRVDPQDALRQTRGAGTRGRFTSVLAAAEIAVSVVLLVAGGLMIRSLAALQAVDLGFRRDHVLSMSLAMGGSRYATPAGVRDFYAGVLARAAAIPGVRSAGISLGQAPWDTPDATAFDIVGLPPVKPGEFRGAALERVSPDYFRVMGMNLAKGRFFTAADDQRSPRVALVSRTLVAMYLPGDDPLGKTVLLGDDKLTIVGVVSDIKFGGPQAIDAPFLYLPMAQSPARNGALSLLVSGDPMSAAGGARAAVAQVDGDTPVTKVRTLESIALGSMAQPRMETGLMAAFAALALLLAALGIYGVLSYAVSQSSHELGVRMALGAGPGAVLGMVLARGAMLTATGLAAGLLGAWGLTRLLRGMLFHVQPADPLTFAAVALLLGVVAMAAAWIPARRATHADPLVAMRAE